MGLIDVILCVCPEKVLRLVHSPDIHTQMGEVARHEVMKKHNIHVIAQQVNSIIQEALEK